MAELIDRAPATACAVHHARPADGPTTVLLHGLASSSSVWTPVLRGESTGLDLWTAELPWGGNHPSSWGYQPDATWAIRDALDQVPNETRIVVAHSFATVLLLELLSNELSAGLDPFARHGIDTLVLVSPFYRRDPEHFEYAMVSELLDGFWRTMDDGIRVMAGDRVDPELRADMTQRVCERVGPYGYLSFFASYLRTPWLRTDLITVPTLVITGERDFVAVPAEGLALTADLPDARCRVIPDAGHFPMVERAAAVNAALHEFLRESRYA